MTALRTAEKRYAIVYNRYLRAARASSAKPSFANQQVEQVDAQARDEVSVEP